MSNKLSCGCTPDASGYGYCSKCVSSLRNKIWRELTPSQREYDRTFAPQQSRDYDDYYNPDEQGCSCHINPPCSYCTSKNEDDYDN